MLPIALLSFMLSPPRALSEHMVRARPAVAYVDDTPLSFFERLESNVLSETAFEAALHEAQSWLKTEDLNNAAAVKHSVLRPSGRAALQAIDTLMMPGTRTLSSVDIHETDEGDYKVTTTGMQGFDAADIDVSVEDGVLTISAESSRTENGVTSFRSSFRRSVLLPADADGDVLSTLHKDDGAISVVMPRVGDAPALGDELYAQAAAEAEALAAESPRFARWLKAHGCLYDYVQPEDDDAAQSV